MKKILKKLNTPGKLDGSLYLFINNKLEIELHDLNFREREGINIHGNDIR